MQTQAVLIHHTGAADVMQIETVEISPPAFGEVRIRQTAIGLNFADVYMRRGQTGPHEAATFPARLGGQSAGIVSEVGEGVADLAVGDAVASLWPGAYARDLVVPASRLLKLPSAITPEFSAAWLVRGLTAEYLLHRLYPVQPGDFVLVHAAAGGMGVVLSQWARALGARVIGTVGSAAKAQVARDNGCDEVILYREESFARRVDEITNGSGVAVVYDSVGRDVFLPSLDCLRPRGWIISYGAASGPVEPFDIQLLHHKSLVVTRPTLASFIATAEDRNAAAASFFDAVTAGKLILPEARRYAFDDVRRAHQDLEGGMTTGSAILTT